jgi:large subunit ribosomal protein L23
MLDIYDVLKRPLVTERAMQRLEESNTYVFEVHPKANKVQVRKAVERLFEVTVLQVNTARVAGKPRRRGATAFHTPGLKKAYVKLKEGDTIELF